MRLIRLNQIVRGAEEETEPIWLNPEQITSIEPRATGSMIYGVRYAIRVRETPAQILDSLRWEETQK